MGGGGDILELLEGEDLVEVALKTKKDERVSRSQATRESKNEELDVSRPSRILSFSAPSTQRPLKAFDGRKRRVYSRRWR